MIVIYISNIDSESAAKNPVPYDQSQYALTYGGSYLVLGISFISGDGSRSSKILYQVLNDFGGISHVPVGLFELQDNRCSAYWSARYDSDGSLLFWPKEFFVDYFHDDLSEGRGAAIDVFLEVIKILKGEAGIS